jgi:hypothetical protein
VAPGLSEALETWTSFYANHAAVRTAVTFTHIAGLVGGGGCAIMADRLTLAVVPKGPVEQADHLLLLRSTHRVVIAGLVALVVSGVLMLAADADTFIHSKIFWVKIALFALLLANGALLVRAERGADEDRARAWSLLGYLTVASLVLWTLITVLGAALPNIG